MTVGSFHPRIFAHFIRHMMRPVAFCLFLAVGALPGCALADSDPRDTAGEHGVGVGDDYVIGPTDVLEVNVWREPSLSRIVPVRPDGKISLPLLDDVEAAGLTALQLKTTLERDLARFVENPTVSVSVQEIQSKNIYILGKVNTPGQYPLRQGLTVLQALSLAGGFAEWADEGDIVIVRQEAGKQRRIDFNYKSASKGKRLEENILLQPGDTIIVP
jgi:polysaccharide export outer membrane protein